MVHVNSKTANQTAVLFESLLFAHALTFLSFVTTPTDPLQMQTSLDYE